MSEYTKGQIWGGLRKAWKEQPESRWTWLAALIDGEGSIGIYISNNKTVHGSPNRATLSIYNTDSELVYLVKEAVGAGWVSKVKRTKGYRDYYRWSCGPTTLRWLLPKIAQYLIVKHRIVAPVEEFLLLTNERMCKGNSTERSNLHLQRMVELKQEAIRANERV